jgi:hypothetical protein
MADTYMTYGGLAGMRIGGGAALVMRELACPQDTGCATRWSESVEECPRHRVRMVPVPAPPARVGKHRRQ